MAFTTPARFLFFAQQQYLALPTSAAWEAAAIDRTAFAQLITAIRWNLYGHPRPSLTLPTVHDDGAAGYTVLTYSGATYLDDAITFGPGVDRASVAVALAMVRYYSDAVDIRRYTGPSCDLLPLCRSYLTGSEDDRAGVLGMMVADYLTDHGYCDTDSSW